MKNGVREIAKLARVSIGTVSNVLNRPEVVSPDTVERVNDAIQKLGYKAGTHKQRRRLALCDNPESDALVEKAIAEGIKIEKICLCDEGQREKVLRYLLENKASAGAILLLGQAGSLAKELGNVLGS